MDRRQVHVLGSIPNEATAMRAVIIPDDDFPWDALRWRRGWYETNENRDVNTLAMENG